MPLRLLLLTALLLTLAPCLGFLGGVAYLQARQVGAFSRWHSLGAPPGGGGDIVNGDLDTVYVRTSSGDLYGCYHRGTGQDCWEAAEEPLRIDPEARFDRQVYEGDLKLPSGVVDTLCVSRWYVEDAYQTCYAVLQDGTVWKWEYDQGGYWGLLIMAVGAAGGMVVGVVAVAAVWLLRRRRT